MQMVFCNMLSETNQFMALKEVATFSFLWDINCTL